MNKFAQFTKCTAKLTRNLGVASLLILGVEHVAHAGVNMATLDIDWSNVVVELSNPNSVFTWDSQSQSSFINGYSNGNQDNSTYTGTSNTGGWGALSLSHMSSVGNGQTNNLTNQSTQLLSQTNNFGDLSSPSCSPCLNFAQGSVNRYGGFTFTGKGAVTIKLPYTTTLKFDNTDTPYVLGVSSSASLSGSFNQQSGSGNVYDSFSFAARNGDLSGLGTHNSKPLEITFSNAGNNSIMTGNINLYAYTSAFSPVTAAVPEPETYAMMMAGLGLVGVVARRRKQLGTAANAV